MFDIPDSIKSEIESEEYTLDGIGMSGSSILIFKDKVLKIQDISEEADNEVQAMRWLNGRVSVPKIITYERKENKSYLLMTKAEGKMACDEYYMDNPEKLTSLLAAALHELWKINISSCPLDSSLNRKLQKARYYVENNLVDTENTEPDTFGENGFKDPEDLLQWLTTHRPEEDLVLSHGDFCLPNIYIENDKFTFIDLGRTGIADKWCDIAICYRSLKHNYSGKYAKKEYPDYNPDMLFEKLGIEPDREKIRYYLLLDELF
ncbi:MAG: aminoglycoside 3'-phosphotransferase [Oscillospiraceae bacterium]|nr:aminoglycoside 3'-phosphotransferase [Oscillospiraceae bacterium]